MKKLFFISILISFVFISFGQSPSAQSAIARLQKDIPDLLRKADVPGLSIGLIRDGKLVWTGAFGVTNSKTNVPVTGKTVFEAASLSKPVFAYGVLKLVDEGKLSLDTPLNKYLGNNYDVKNDDRINLITARRVLSHTSGFPNWRFMDGGQDLLIHFTPGEKFSYSGEGMVYLGKVVEKITGMPIADYLQENVLKPLGMESSSYTWQNRYDSLKAYRHDMMGNFTGRNQPDSGSKEPETANVAASLVTNATDYGKFLVAVLNGVGLKKATWKEVFTPQIRVNPKYPELAWGLGWGLETMPEGEYFWHWGDNGDSKAYITALIPTRDAVVYFADGNNGLSFTKEILDDAMGGSHPALAHLDYDRYNSLAHTLIKTIWTKGAAAGLAEYNEQVRADTTKKISEEQINSMGYYLMNSKKLDDAIAVFTQNTIDHPNSWNVWDSLGEAYMNKGNKELAIKYYEKSLQLNPDSKNGAATLKKLKS